jgi:hypothetical protein
MTRPTITTAAAVYMAAFLAHPASTSLAKTRAIGWSQRQENPAMALRACADAAYRYECDDLADALYWLSDDWRLESMTDSPAA